MGMDYKRRLTEMFMLGSGHKENGKAGVKYS